MDYGQVNVAELRIRLQEREVQFDKRTGVKKLVELAETREIEVPMISVNGAGAPNNSGDKSAKTEEEKAAEKAAKAKEVEERRAAKKAEKAAEASKRKEERDAERARKKAERQEAGAEDGNIVPVKYRNKYGKEANNGDEIAAAFKEHVTIYDEKGKNPKCSEARLQQVAEANGIDLEGRFGHLNIGQKRMNLGNVIRGMVRQGKAVTIGAKTWEAKEEPKTPAEGSEGKEGDDREEKLE